jgi:hypothetical protein
LGLETAQQHKEARLQAIVANKARNARIAALFKLPLLLSFFSFSLLLLGFASHPCAQAEVEMPNFMLLQWAGLAGPRINL